MPRTRSRSFRHAYLTLNGTGFKIEDNCGGIPVDALRTWFFGSANHLTTQWGSASSASASIQALFKLGTVNI